MNISCPLQNTRFGVCVSVCVCMLTCISALELPYTLQRHLVHCVMYRDKVAANLQNV